jgi:HEAT repeat protein
MRRRSKLLAALLFVHCTLAHAADIDSQVQKLVSENDAEAAPAAAALGSNPDHRASEALFDALAVGVSVPVQAGMLQGMLSRGPEARLDPKAFDVLEHLLRSRTPEIRVAAVKVVGNIKDARVAPALIRALSDSNGEVRAQAAQALGRRKERTAEAPLMQLLRRGDAASAPALAAIATPDLAHTLAEMSGSVSDALLCTALGEMLKRPDFNEPLRVELVHTLAKIPSVDSTAALIDYVAATAKAGNSPSRQEASKIVEERSSR